jgi:hypothetical protein
MNEKKPEREDDKDRKSELGDLAPREDVKGGSKPPGHGKPFNPQPDPPG